MVHTNRGQVHMRSPLKPGWR